MDFLTPPRPAKGSSDRELIRWARASLTDVRDDLEVLRSSVGIFSYKPGRPREDLTPKLIARLERRAELLACFIDRKRNAADIS